MCVSLCVCEFMCVCEYMCVCVCVRYMYVCVVHVWYMYVCADIMFNILMSICMCACTCIHVLYICEYMYNVTSCMRTYILCSHVLMYVRVCIYIHVCSTVM